MKKLIIWTISAMILMIGFPWLAVTFAGSAGMAICFLLFFALTPYMLRCVAHLPVRTLRNCGRSPLLQQDCFWQEHGCSLN